MLCSKKELSRVEPLNRALANFYLYLPKRNFDYKKTLKRLINLMTPVNPRGGRCRGWYFGRESLARSRWGNKDGCLESTRTEKNIPLISFTSLFTLLIYLRRTNRLVIDSHEQSRVCCVSS